MEIIDDKKYNKLFNFKIQEKTKELMQKYNLLNQKDKLEVLGTILEYYKVEQISNDEIIEFKIDLDTLSIFDILDLEKNLETKYFLILRTNNFIDNQQYNKQKVKGMKK